MMMSEKKCSKCGGVKPASQFYRDASSSTGLDSCCRECRRAYARSRPKRDCPSVDAKICSHCCEVKPACEFGKNARESTGLQPWCRACHSAYVNNKPKVDSPIVSEKRCSKCNLVKPAGQFCKDKYKPSGLRSWCRQCRNLARAATRNEAPRVSRQKCRGCGHVKAAEDFPKCKENASGLKSLCQACRDSAQDNDLGRFDGGAPRGALKRKASNVDSGDRFSGGGGDRQVKACQGADGDAGDSPAGGGGSGSAESPFPFSIPTKPRSGRKAGGTGHSPTSQWNNGNGVFSQTMEEMLSVGWGGGGGAGQVGVIPSSPLPEGSLFSTSPFGVALDPVKLEQMSSAQAVAPYMHPVPTQAPAQGIWVEAFNGQMQCPVFVPGQFPTMGAGPPMVPCMQLVMAPGGVGPQACQEGQEAAPIEEAAAAKGVEEEGSRSQTSSQQQSPSGLEVLAEAAEMEMNMSEVPSPAEVSNH